MKCTVCLIFFFLNRANINAFITSSRHPQQSNRNVIGFSHKLPGPLAFSLKKASHTWCGIILNNIKMDLQEIGWECVDDRVKCEVLLKMEMNLWVSFCSVLLVC